MSPHSATSHLCHLGGCGVIFWAVFPVTKDVVAPILQSCRGARTSMGNALLLKFICGLPGRRFKWASCIFIEVREPRSSRAPGCTKRFLAHPLVFRSRLATPTVETLRGAPCWAPLTTPIDLPAPGAHAPTVSPSQRGRQTRRGGKCPRTTVLGGGTEPKPRLSPEPLSRLDM